MKKVSSNRPVGQLAKTKMVHKEVEETEETEEIEKKIKETQQSCPDGHVVYSSNSLFQTWLRGIFERVIKEPGGTNKSSSNVFECARHFKAHPQYGRLSAEAIIDLIEPQLQKWEKEAKVSDFWESSCGVSREDAHLEIVDSWDQIKRLPGLAALENAWEFARRYPLITTQENCKKHGYKKYHEFLSLCGWLQVILGENRAIAVPCREVGELLGVSPMSVSRMRNWAVRDGYMKQTVEHVLNGQNAEDNKATRFRFSYEKWPKLAENMNRENFYDQQHNQ